MMQHLKSRGFHPYGVLFLSVPSLENTDQQMENLENQWKILQFSKQINIEKPAEIQGF